MKKKTITLSKDTYFYLLDVSTRNLERIERDSNYTEEDCKNYRWMSEDKKIALDLLPIAKRLHEAILFGEEDDDRK